jgi:hypothetical protein
MILAMWFSLAPGTEQHQRGLPRPAPIRV